MEKWYHNRYMYVYMLWGAMPKAKISVSLDVKVISWVDEQVEKGVFKNRSRGIEHCVKQRMRDEK